MKRDNNLEQEFGENKMVKRIIYITNITKGQQITIPMKIRDMLGVDIGDDIIWLQKDNRIILSSIKNIPIQNILDRGKITTAGIITIPVKIRYYLGVEIGDDVVFVLDDKTRDIIVQNPIIEYDETEYEKINNKLEIALELICLLYKENLIEDAFLVGPIVKGVNKDVDIVIINPLFENIIDLSLLQLQYKEDKIMNEIKLILSNPILKQIIDYLENIGVQSYLSEEKKHNRWEIVTHQIYKDEFVHIWGANKPDIQGPSIRIKKDDC